MSVLRMIITVTQMLSVSILKVTSSASAGQDTKEVVKCAQVTISVYYVYESVYYNTY